MPNHGGGQDTGRLATFRPDVQGRVEAMNPNGSAQGKVFDGMPTALAGVAGFGRTQTPGTPPAYAPDSTTRGNERGFRASFVRGLAKAGMTDGFAATRERLASRREEDINRNSDRTVLSPPAGEAYPVTRQRPRGGATSTRLRRPSYANQ